jgi:hypothetical protein
VKSPIVSGCHALKSWKSSAYEFPPVDDAIQEPVRTAKDWTYPSARSLLRRHLHGPHCVWIKKLLILHRLSRLKGQVMRFEGEYDDPPVPSLLLVFRENDAIQACFDHESERYNETTNEPSCAVCFRPEVGEEFDTAIRTMAIFLKINIELAGLITLLNDCEEKHERQREHRAEPSLGYYCPTPAKVKSTQAAGLGDGSVEGGTGDTEANADLLNPVFRSAAPQASCFYAATRRRVVFGEA